MLDMYIYKFKGGPADGREVSRSEIPEHNPEWMIYAASNPMALYARTDDPGVYEYSPPPPAEA